MPITSGGATYNRQSYIDGIGQPAVTFLQSSYNPGLGFNWDATDVIYQFEPGVSEFQFANPGAGGVAGSALGTTSSGDVVEAYWLLSSPATLAYYVYTPTAQHQTVLTATAGGFTGPITVGKGYLPRLADGAAGLFMLSTDSPHGGEPTAVEIRKYNASTHTFGAPDRIAGTPASAGALFTGGGLGENYDTGQLAAVSPSLGSSSDVMRLYLSSDGGGHFSEAQDVASIGDAYAGPDNARVSIADNGTGFVTFQDHRGLEVADLQPLPAQFKHVHAHGKSAGVPVTCPAPKGSCSVQLTLAVAHYKQPLRSHFTVAAGVTRTLRLRLPKAVQTLLRSDHGSLKARLTVLIRVRGASAEKLALQLKL